MMGGDPLLSGFEDPEEFGFETRAIRVSLDSNRQHSWAACDRSYVGVSRPAESRARFLDPHEMFVGH